MSYRIDQVDDLLSGLRIGAAPGLVPFPGLRPTFAIGPHPYPHPYGPPHMAPPHAAPPRGPWDPRGLGSPFNIGNTMLQQTSPTKDGQLVLPMSSSGTIAAATSSTVTARPQIPAFRPERVVISDSIASSFTLDDIKVGNTSQFVQAGSIPASAFVQGAFGVEMRMDTVQTAMDFVFAVTNTDVTSAHQFLSVVFGRSVY